MDSLGNKWDIDWPTIIKLSWKEVSIIATSQHCNAALQWAISPECSWKGVIILRIRAHVFVLDGIDVRGMWIEFSMVWRKRVCTLLIIVRCPCWVKTNLFSWKIQESLLLRLDIARVIPAKSKNSSAHTFGFVPFSGGAQQGDRLRRVAQVGPPLHPRPQCLCHQESRAKSRAAWVDGRTAG